MWEGWSQVKEVTKKKKKCRNETEIDCDLVCRDATANSHLAFNDMQLYLYAKL